jgi:Ca2+-binding RTX toxin-like protein
MSNVSAPFDLDDTLVIGTAGQYDGFDVLNIRNTNALDGVIVQLSTGFSYTMQGVLLNQLENFNIEIDNQVFMIGTEFSDDLTGTVVLGLGSNDEIEGQNHTNDFLQGNQGDDDIDGNGDHEDDFENSDRIRGGQGHDDIYDFGTGSIVHGDLGEDWIKAEYRADGVTIFGGNLDQAAMDAGDDIYGSKGDDYIHGNAGNDDIYGKDGHDTLRGGKGDDEIYGGDGNDWITGDLGDDELRGGDGEDTLFGGSNGNDKLEGNEGDDELNGGVGNDWIDGDKGADLMSGGDGQDIFAFWRDGPYVPSPLWNLDDSNQREYLAGQIRSENFTDGTMPEDPGTITPSSYDSSGRNGMFDRITDLDFGGDGIGTEQDRLAFQGWDGGDGDIETTSVDASNIGGILDAATDEMPPDSGDDDAVIVDVTGGGFANRSFLLVEVDYGDDNGPEGPEGDDYDGQWDYMIEITGYTGDFDESDLLSLPDVL